MPADGARPLDARSASSLFVAIAFAALIHGFVVSDFSVVNVARQLALAASR